MQMPSQHWWAWFAVQVAAILTATTLCNVAPDLRWETGWIFVCGALYVYAQEQGSRGP